MKRLPLKRSLREDQSGVAFAFVAGVAAIFITIVVWHVLTGPMEEVIGVADNLRPPENTLGGTETRGFMTAIWTLLPFLIVLGIILWMFVYGYRNIYGQGMGG